MATGMITTTELAVINNRNLSGNIVDELLQAAPVFSQMAAQPASNGITHNYLAYDTAPPAGYRALNAGRTEGFSEDDLRTLTLAILDASFTIDVAAGDIYKDGPEGLLQREGMRALKTAFATAGRQLFYGTTALGDSGGNTGLANNANLNALADDMVNSAGGSTADSQTSVYLLHSSETDVCVVLGNGGNIRMHDTIKQRIVDGSGDPFTAYHTPVLGWTGLQIGGKYSASRICNVESSLTDDMIAAAIDLHPTDRMPNMVCMSRKARGLLRASRTATNPSGTPADYPETVFGIPIITTDEIVNTEPVVS